MPNDAAPLQRRGRLRELTGSTSERRRAEGSTGTAGVCPRDYRLPGSEAGGASARQGAWFLQNSEQGWLVGGEERGSRFLSASFPARRALLSLPPDDS